MRKRATGLLMLGRKVEPQPIAEQLRVSGQSTYNRSHPWRDTGVCGLTGGHCGGRPPALSNEMIATALEVTRAESLTLAQIAQRVQAIHAEPLPCRIETLGEALKREGFSFKRNRYTLKRSATKRNSS